MCFFFSNSFAAIIGEPVGITIASFSLGFSMHFSNGTAKNTFKDKREKKKKHNKLVFADKGKLYSIEKIQSKALKDKEISWEDFTKIINEERNYHKMKESIRIIKMWKKQCRNK